MHVIALGAGQSLFALHEMVHSIFVIIAKGSHSPEVQSDACVHVVQRSAGTPPSPPPELLPLLEPLELPELLPLLEPLELLPLLDPLELPEELPLPEPLSASDPELEPGPMGPEDDELEQAGIHRTRSVDAARARVRRSLMPSRMTRGTGPRQLLSAPLREMFHACSFRVTTRGPRTRPHAPVTGRSLSNMSGAGLGVGVDVDYRLSRPWSIGLEGQYQELTAEHDLARQARRGRA